MSEDGEHPSDGPLIGGRYRLVARIGSGPTGTVWRARDEQEHGDVAVKEPLLPADPAVDEESARIAHRLWHEARAATRVRHPSAVTPRDVVTEDGLPWIVTELVEGESLREAVRRGPLPPAEAARVGLAVLGALRAAHAVGIVHRDIKPANVLIESGSGRVVVTDFGIGDGHAAGHAEHAGQGRDTPAGFVAPERTNGIGAGPASDLWSLGALLADAVEGGDAGPLAPLLARLRAPEPEGRPRAEEVAGVLEAYLGVRAGAEKAWEAGAEGARAAAAEGAWEPGAEKVREAGPTAPSAAPTPLTADPSASPPTSTPAPTPSTSRATPGTRRRTPLAALGLLLAKKPGAE
ncbi:serine/threonine protein kinase [Streptomyces sp. NBC_00820]|uniref:serine/threonine-protein kinase n=1 Tax=Streptomyces sp. NBC_00820 TaxID=2975842 RepID=UPI002ED1251D|nr:serine/threonine protein kinase [Streptomyces sp. NBC_00820]